MRTTGSKSVHITIRTLIAFRSPVYRGCNVGECPKVCVVRFRSGQMLERHLSENAMALRQNRMLLAVLLGPVWVGAAFGAADDWTRTASVAPGSRVIVK